MNQAEKSPPASDCRSAASRSRPKPANRDYGAQQ